MPRACYEASGAGYVLQRTLSADGFHCEVIAPSLIPSRPATTARPTAWTPSTWPDSSAAAT